MLGFHAIKNVGDPFPLLLTLWHISKFHLNQVPEIIGGPGEYTVEGRNFTSTVCWLFLYLQCLFCPSQLSCLRHICLTLTVALNKLIICNVALNTLTFTKLKQELPFFQTQAMQFILPKHLQKLSEAVFMTSCHEYK